MTVMPFLLHREFLIDKEAKMEKEELEKPLENNESQDTKGNIKRLIGIIIFFAAFPFL